MKKMDWNLIRAFHATIATGSLSAAARQLGLTQPTLSRQIAAFEAELGVTLFERIGKRLAPTESALALIEHARLVADAADGLALAAAGKAESIAGRVSISATDAVSAYLLPETIARIRARAPEITIVIVATNALSDLRRREADIAIRHVRPSEPELIGRSLGEMHAHFYAAESWLARHAYPRSVADLKGADLIGFEPVEDFARHLARSGIAIPPESFRLVSAHAVVLWEMVRAGLGIGMMLDEVATRMPGLTRLLPDLPTTPVPLWLVTHRELSTSRRVRIVFDLLAEDIARRWIASGG